MIGEDGCLQCGGLGTIEVTRARSQRTAQALCKCVFSVLLGEISTLGEELQRANEGPHTGPHTQRYTDPLVTPGLPDGP